MLKPFWSFYGGKWRAAPHYPEPQHRTIIEPFAGAGGYSTRYADRDVVLVEKDPTIAALWRYLIAVNRAEIERLPFVPMGGSVDDLNVSPAERTLIGFWLNKGTTHPCRVPSAWMRGGLRPKSYWGPEIRARIADQVGAISHWTVIEGDYTEAPNIAATWFIDPPYQKAGDRYRCSAKSLDFAALGSWCREREGQVMVCEAEGADWLPFERLGSFKATHGHGRDGRTAEALWTNQT